MPRRFVHALQHGRPQHPLRIVSCVPHQERRHLWNNQQPVVPLRKQDCMRAGCRMDTRPVEKRQERGRTSYGLVTCTSHLLRAWDLGIVGSVLDVSVCCVRACVALPRRSSHVGARARCPTLSALHDDAISGRQRERGRSVADSHARVAEILSVGSTEGGRGPRIALAPRSAQDEPRCQG